MNIILEDWKYEYREKDGVQCVFRYGEPWKDITGDKFTYLMAAEIDQLRQRVAELEAHNVSLMLEQTMRKAGEKSNIRLATELAAAQLENKRLRSALESAESALDECRDYPITYQEVCEALREPTDTEALEKYRNSVLEESAIYCDLQQDEPECPERAAYCAEAIRNLKKEKVNQ